MTTLRKRFKLPWKQIVEAAGLRYPCMTTRRIPAEELRADILRVVSEMGRPPTRSEYQAHGTYTAKTLRRRSGEKSWEAVLNCLAGIKYEEVN